MRTGMMDALVFKALGTTKLANKKLLMVGSGKTATWSLRGLAALFPDLTEISYLNTGLKNAEFEALATSLSVVIKHVEDKDISSYDYIMCHSKAKESIFNDPTQVKNGAVLTGFISSTPYGEFADSFYNTSQANIIIDWDPNLARMKFIGRQIDAGVVSRDKMFDFRELLNKSPKLNPGAKYTIFTSMGTPIQNLAVLKLLTE
jgi:ornithine cyclodeaminase/alanine dehydrogenase-like protein (mu-crystallin family)